jgi:hypothetical protein
MSFRLISPLASKDQPSTYATFKQMLASKTATWLKNLATKAEARSRNVTRRYIRDVYNPVGKAFIISNQQNEEGKFYYLQCERYVIDDASEPFESSSENQTYIVGIDVVTGFKVTAYIMQTHVFAKEIPVEDLLHRITVEGQEALSKHLATLSISNTSDVVVKYCHASPN